MTAASPAATHEVFNQSTPWADVNLFTANQPLPDALRLHAPGLPLAGLAALGAEMGSAEMQTHARLANTYKPQLRTHDRFGYRTDVVEFHPSYHALIGTALRHGLHATPWSRQGMGMTEKQGGSDVRANTTQAVHDGEDAWGARYRITGHKWFFSAPMCDAFLILAQAPGGLTCFFLPRVLPDGGEGTVNAIRIQRLKDKLGDHANASSEVEFINALAWRVGEEGRG